MVTDEEVLASLSQVWIGSVCVCVVAEAVAREGKGFVTTRVFVSLPLYSV